MIERKSIKFFGLAEFAQRLPNSDWHEIKVRIRKAPDSSADVYVYDEVENIETGEIIDIELLNVNKKVG